jgi:hypothetical protein
VPVFYCWFTKASHDGIVTIRHNILTDSKKNGSLYSVASSTSHSLTARKSSLTLRITVLSLFSINEFSESVSIVKHSSEQCLLNIKFLLQSSCRYRQQWCYQQLLYVSALRLLCWIDLNPGKSSVFFSSRNCLHRLWSLSSILYSGYWGPYQK